jgi:cellulose synthase operon protein C
MGSLHRLLGAVPVLKALVIAISVFFLDTALHDPAVAKISESVQHADRYARAERYFKKGDYTSSAIELKNILQKDPANLPARIFMGRVYLRVGAVEFAIKELRRARELGGDEELIILPLVSAKLMDRDFKGALSHNPNPEWSARARAALYSLHGQAYIGLRKYADAETALTKTLEIEPESSMALAAFARLNVKLGNKDTAISTIETALELDSGNFHLWHVKGEVDRFAGQPDKAVESFGRALRIRKDYAASRIGRASALVETRQYKEALKDISTSDETNRRIHLPNFCIQKFCSTLARFYVTARP